MEIIIKMMKRIILTLQSNFFVKKVVMLEESQPILSVGFLLMFFPVLSQIQYQRCCESVMRVMIQYVFIRNAIASSRGS